ncbi:uncharacterized protein LOC109401358 [Aedes albopictus]|uniref:Uncharacterized protein n=1 Tax=Aedes albopictus TaxID=7160 RepID=A0ABM1ZCF2_AEDAL|nr:uncharacterized protein LOC109401358 [Aedes albopictus]
MASLSLSVDGEGEGDDDDYRWLETASFSIRSPRARAEKCVQQELIRASERRHRPRKDRYLRAVGSKWWRNSALRRKSLLLKEAHKYLPQCDELLQNAADLYIARKLQNRTFPLKISEFQQFDKIVQDTIQQFTQQPASVHKQYVREVVLSKFKQTYTCSDPFQLLLALHWRHCSANLIHRNGSTKLDTDIDIGPFAHNIERAEAGEEADPTRLRLISWNNCVTEARNLWKLMSPDQKLPFFVQAYMASHLPASVDQALL